MPTTSDTRRAGRRRVPEDLTGRELIVFRRMEAAYKTRPRTLEVYHRLGTLLREICPLETRRGRYGLVTGVAAALGCNASLLNKARQFAGLYSAPQVRGLMRDGHSWGMICAVLCVEDEARRADLLTPPEADEVSWGAGEVRARVERGKEGPPHAGGRHRVVRGLGASGGLRAVARVSGAWIKRHDGEWAEGGERLLARLAAVPTSSPPEGLPGLLTDAVTRLGGLVEKASSLKAALEAEKLRLGRAGRARRR